MKYYYEYESIIGILRFTEENQKLTELSIVTEKQTAKEIQETPLLLKTKQQLEEYFSGNRREFDLPLEPCGTDFQKKVWQQLCKIPYGQTRTYGEIAEAAGCPKGAVAVGQANHNNKIMILIPCHRVIGANGKLVGFAAGLEVKKALLSLENQYLKI